MAVAVGVAVTVVVAAAVAMPIMNFCREIIQEKRLVDTKGSLSDDTYSRCSLVLKIKQSEWDDNFLLFHYGCTTLISLFLFNWIFPNT